MAPSTPPSHNKGFSLIEILLALALTAFIITGVAGGLILSNRLTASANGRTTARLMGEECLAVVRWMRDSNGLEYLGVGEHGLASGSGQWELTAEPDQTATHTRLVSITESAVASTRDIGCVISWTENDNPASLSFVTRLAP